jgi:hypothetical protein
MRLNSKCDLCCAKATYYFYCKVCNYEGNEFCEYFFCSECHNETKRCIGDCGNKVYGEDFEE